MALYNPGKTDWKKTLQTSMQPSAVSTGGQMAGLGGSQPQARTATVTQPAQQSSVYNAASSPSAQALNPDNVNWGVQPDPNNSGAPDMMAASQPGSGYQIAPYSAGKAMGSSGWNITHDSRYGGAYEADTYQGSPTLWYEDNFTSDPNIPEVHTQSGVPDASAEMARFIESNRNNPYQPDDAGQGMTSAMKEIYDSLGTLNIDNVGFYQGLKGSPGMDYATWAAANGIPANGGDNQWGYLMFDNWNNMIANGTIKPTGGGNGAPGPNPNDKPPAMLDDPLERPDKNKGNGHKKNNNNGNGHKNNNGGGGGNNNRNNGPHGGSGYGPQGMQGPGGGRPNNGGGNNNNNNNRNNNNGGGNKNNGGGNNNKKK